jgi:long-chain acyl-CoA synthetase
MKPASVPACFQAAFDRLGDRPLLEDREGTVAFSEVLRQAAALSQAFRRRGLAKGDRVGFWADNSRRWIVCDLAIQAAGGVTCPRGTDTPEAEILEIFRHAEVSWVLVHDARTAARFERIRAELPRLREVVVVDPGRATGVPGTTFDRLVEEGASAPSLGECAAAVGPDDVATIIYTSGTTGRPKGVVLTQGNFLHQIEVIPGTLNIGPDDVFLSILPPWHIFERTVEYVALTQGARLVYTDLRSFRGDLASKHPTFVPSVPRVWEAVHDAVRRTLAEGTALKRALFALGYRVADARASARDLFRGHVVRKGGGRASWIERALAGVGAALLWVPDMLLRSVLFRRLKAMTGGRLRGAVVGGGLMPAHVDRFFRAVGLHVLVGYGLTETAPVVTVRREGRNVLGTIGTAIAGVEIRIRDPQTGADLPQGQVGVVWTRGPQVMRGYHRDEELTRKAIDTEGWFDTGDLGMLTVEGDLCFRGRQKETIVLSGGENVEPSRVEAEILPCPLVEQAIVVGQDRKTLAVLLVAKPVDLARRVGAPEGTALAALVAREDVRALLRQEIVRRTGPGSGLRPFEQVSRVVLLDAPLTPENGLLTATMKPRRHVVVTRYHDLIEAAYR